VQTCPTKLQKELLMERGAESHSSISAVAADGGAEKWRELTVVVVYTRGRQRGDRL
jgi:hypothetical protein